MFSDFWVEQGARVINTIAGYNTCNLVKGYNINYVIVEGSCEDMNNLDICSTGIEKINLSSFKYLSTINHVAYAEPFSYIASGY